METEVALEYKVRNKISEVICGHFNLSEKVFSDSYEMGMLDADSPNRETNDKMRL